MAVRVVLSAALLLTVASGRTQPNAEWQTCAEDPRPPPDLSVARTSHQDGAPIITARCASCHRTGGIAPFALTNWAEVFAARTARAPTLGLLRTPTMIAQSDTVSRTRGSNLLSLGLGVTWE